MTKKELICVYHWFKKEDNRISRLYIYIYHSTGNKHCFASECKGNEKKNKRKRRINNNNERAKDRKKKNLFIQGRSRAFNNRKLSSNNCLDGESDTVFSRSSNKHRISCKM